MGWSLASSRAAFDHRIVVTGTGREELLVGLRAAAAGEPGPGVDVAGPGVGVARPGRVGVLFPGQGAQRAGMCRELNEASPVFASALDAVLAELDPLLDRPLAGVLWGDDAGLLDQTGWAQPALFAVEAALFELLGACGIRSDFLLGHSIGELTAAYVAGVWSLRDACRVVAARARLMQALPPGGAMAAVDVPEHEITELLPPEVSVAAVNTADSVVISGPQARVDEVVGLVIAHGARVSRLRVSHAFHSDLMDPVLRDFGRVLESVQVAEPRIPVVSNMTGQVTTAEQLRSPEYWARQVREPVRFADGVRCLGEHGVTALVELGPDGVLSGLAQHSCAPSTVLVPVLRRPRPEAGSEPGDVGTVMSALAQLYVHGVAVDWAAVFAGTGARRVGLPTYAFQHQRFWPDAGGGVADVAGAGLAAAGHPLLGAVLPLPGSGGVVLTSRLSLRTHPWLADYTVRDTVVFPGTGFVELAIRAGDSVGCDRVEELAVETPLVLPAHGGVQVQVVIGGAVGGTGAAFPAEPGAGEVPGRRSVEVYARADGQEDWTRHATGVVSVSSSGGTGQDRADGLPDAAFGAVAGAWPPPGATELDTELFYEQLAGEGFAVYGPGVPWAVPGLASRGWPGAGGGGTPGGGPGTGGIVRHSSGAAGCGAARVGVRGAGGGGLPSGFTGMVLHASGASRLRVALTRTGPDQVAVAAADGAGVPVLSAGSVAIRPARWAAWPAAWVTVPCSRCSGPRPVPVRPRSRCGSGRPPGPAGPAGRAGAGYAGLAEVGAALDGGAPVPQAVLLAVSGDPDPGAVVASVHELAGWVLGQLHTGWPPAVCRDPAGGGDRGRGRRAPGEPA